MPIRTRARRRGATSSAKRAVDANIRKIAKKVVYAVAETKSPMSSTNHALLGDTVYAHNLNAFIAQGDTAENVEGEKLYLKNFTFKGTLANNAVATNNEPVHIRMCLVRTKKPLTVTQTFIIPADVFRGAVEHYATEGHLDMHKVDVIYDKLFTIKMPDISTVNQTIPFQLKAVLNKTHFFDADNSNYFKDANYYMITTAHKPTAFPLNSVGQVRYVYSVNFKDL